AMTVAALKSLVVRIAAETTPPLPTMIALGVSPGFTLTVTGWKTVSSSWLESLVETGSVELVEAAARSLRDPAARGVIVTVIVAVPPTRSVGRVHEKPVDEVVHAAAPAGTPVTAGAPIVYWLDERLPETVSVTTTPRGRPGPGLVTAIVHVSGRLTRSTS